MKTEFIPTIIPVVSWIVDDLPVAIRRHSHLKLPLIVQLRPQLVGPQTNGKPTTAKLWVPGPNW